MERWSDFFVAEVGAAAALTGLLFVAVSINLTRILEHKHLPARAVEALASLVAVLTIGTFGLIPGQSLMAFGCETLGAGLAIGAVQTSTLIRSHSGVAKYIGWAPHAALSLAPVLPFVIGGVLLVMGNAAGLYWLVPGVLLSFLAAIVGAWVLLIEILR